MAKKHPHGPEHVVSAAFRLAAEKGWRGLSLAEIATHAGVPLAELVEHYPTKAAILESYAKSVDHRMMEGEVEADAPMRDRLFDVIMRRFDAMSPDRRALSVILRETGDDPWSVLCGARRYWKSMALTLETAGISSAGLAGLARTEGLAAVYLYVLRTFLDDDSSDLARTMAALDKALRRTEGVASMLWRTPRGQTPRPAESSA